MTLIFASSVDVVQQKYAAAEPVILRAVKIEETLNGKDGANLVPPLSVLCDLYTRWDKPEKAEPCYGRLDMMLEKQFGPDHPILLQSLMARAQMLRKLGRADEAKQLEQRVQAISAVSGGMPGMGMPGGMPPVDPATGRPR
jgi:hypothetical protein